MRNIDLADEFESRAKALNAVACDLTGEPQHELVRIAADYEACAMRLRAQARVSLSAIPRL